MKTRPRPGIATWRGRRRRGSDHPTLPGLAEALEVYRRIVQDTGAQDHRSWRSPGRQRARAG